MTTQAVIPAPETPHDLLIAVRDLIRDNPERHNQGSWLSNVFMDVSATVAELRPYATQPVPASPVNKSRALCGTTACVAGWAVILGDNDNAATKLDNYSQTSYIRNRAIELLDLHEDQATVLFNSSLTRHAVLECLDALIGDPLADLYALLGDDYDEPIEDYEDDEDDEYYEDDEDDEDEE